MLPARKDSNGEHARIGIPVQMIFYVVVVTYVVAMALIGGAVAGSLHAAGGSADDRCVGFDVCGGEWCSGKGWLRLLCWLLWRRGSGILRTDFRRRITLPTATTLCLHRGWRAVFWRRVIPWRGC